MGEIGQSTFSRTVCLEKESMWNLKYTYLVKRTVAENAQIWLVGSTEKSLDFLLGSR